MSSTAERVGRFATAGWIAGFGFGVGLSSFGWLNPYLSLMLTLAGFVYIAVIWVAFKEATRG